MKDILGREINPGDIVVCMAIGRYSSGMHLGVQSESGFVKTLDGVKHPRNKFLISNPTEQELSIAEEIKSKYKEQEENKIKREQERKSKKAIPYKDLQYCHVYKDDKGRKYIFLGKCKIKAELLNYQHNPPIEYEGYVYIDATYNFSGIKEAINPIISYWYLDKYIKDNYCILKTKKKLVEHIGANDELNDFINQHGGEQSFTYVFFNRPKYSNDRFRITVCRVD